MNEEKKTIETNEVAFEEMEQVEELGGARDFITGAGIGIGAVAAVVAIVT